MIGFFNLGIMEILIIVMTGLLLVAGLVFALSRRGSSGGGG